MTSTQLTTPLGYEVSRIIFSEPIAGSIPDSKPAINYNRILISTKNEDGSIGELILPTCELFTFGVSENVSKETGKVNGYVFPICLYDKQGPSQEQKDWVETFNNIVEHIKKHIITNRESFNQYDLCDSDLKKFNPLYYKKDKGKIIDGTGPTLYSKLIVSRKLNKIVTMFFDNNGDEIDPMDLKGKFCFSKSAVKIESVFIGNKISLQVKLYEAEVRLMDSGMKRLLSKPKTQQNVNTSTNSINPMFSESKDDNDNDDTGSIGEDDDDLSKDTQNMTIESQPVQPIQPIQPTKRRVVKKIVKNTN